MQNVSVKTGGEHEFNHTNQDTPHLKEGLCQNRLCYEQIKFYRRITFENEEKGI